jgi:hypothetical protein
VGGQALNLWAEYYARNTDELELYRPYTSKDLDYFGLQAAARKMATELKGKLLIPDMDDATFESAVVEAEVDGYKLPDRVPDERPRRAPQCTGIVRRRNPRPLPKE